MKFFCLDLQHQIINGVDVHVGIFSTEKFYASDVVPSATLRVHMHARRSGNQDHPAFDCHDKDRSYTMDEITTIVDAHENLIPGKAD